MGCVSSKAQVEGLDSVTWSEEMEKWNIQEAGLHRPLLEELSSV